MSASADETRSEIIAVVRWLMSALVERDGKRLESVFAGSRCKREDVYRVMDAYGSAFAVPPRDAFEDVGIYKIDGEPTLFAVDADLWNEEGKRTDLTVQLTIELCEDDALIVIDDVRVM